MIFRIIIYTCIFNITFVFSFFRAVPRYASTSEELLEIAKEVTLLSETKLVLKGNIGFASIKDDIIGICNPLLHGGYEIDINRRYWDHFNDKEKILLIAHEIRHCSCFYFRHKSQYDSENCPTHYMSSHNPGPYCTLKYYDVYLSQIKRGCDD